MDNLAAKKNVILKLIEQMEDEMSSKLKPGEDDKEPVDGVSVLKIEAKPKMTELEDEDDSYDKEDSDVKSFLGSKDEDDEDMSMLDRFKKKYSKE